MLKLASNHADYLLSQPESGMGYQLVEVTFRSDKRPEAVIYEAKGVQATVPVARTQQAVVYNAELLLLDREQPLLKQAAYGSLLESAKNSAEWISELRFLPDARPSRQTAMAMESSGKYGKTTGPAKDAPPEKTKDGEVFKRFSAYSNDRRVTADGGLLPGTYATTEEDAKNVKTGKEAVARYALPNPTPASYVFTIRPHTDTVIQYGIVQPAYGQLGGGVEVIFTVGTQRNTVTGPLKIPDE
ncbi:MAG TPA: hypothetical protein VL171_12040 [Verrucomicrobiae bacterium]|nr:hypothetical protein [Verrucomicrobiae bacterium]